MRMSSKATSGLCRLAMLDGFARMAGLGHDLHIGTGQQAGKPLANHFVVVGDQ